MCNSCENEVFPTVSQNFVFSKQNFGFFLQEKNKQFLKKACLFRKAVEVCNRKINMLQNRKTRM